MTFPLALHILRRFVNEKDNLLYNTLKLMLCLIDDSAVADKTLNNIINTFKQFILKWIARDGLDQRGTYFITTSMQFELLFNSTLRQVRSLFRNRDRFGEGRHRSMSDMEKAITLKQWPHPDDMSSMFSKSANESFMDPLAEYMQYLEDSSIIAMSSSLEGKRRHVYGFILSAWLCLVAPQRTSTMQRLKLSSVKDVLDTPFTYVKTDKFKTSKVYQLAGAVISNSILKSYFRVWISVGRDFCCGRDRAASSDLLFPQIAGRSESYEVS